MRNALSFSAVGHATSLFLAATFALCVGFDLVYPPYAMHEAWHPLLPGFEWLSFPSFLLGLVESYAYGWYIALVWVPLYNVFLARATRRESRRDA